MVKKKGKKGNSKQIQYRKSNNLLFKYIFVFFVWIFFALFFTNAFTLIKTNIDNAIQVIKRTYFTDSGTLSWNVMMDINAIDGNIFISWSYLSFGSGNFLWLTNSGYLIFLSGAMWPQWPAGIDWTSIVSWWVQSWILYLQYSWANGTWIWNWWNIQWAKWETWDTGPQWPTWAKWETWDTGLQWPTWATGSNWIDGNTWATGPQWIQGNTGAIWATWFLQAWITWATPFWDGIQWITDNTNIFNTWFNIGIATVLPTAKLDINWNLRIRDVEYNWSLTWVLVIDASWFVYQSDASLFVGTGPRWATWAKWETWEAWTPGGPPWATWAIWPTWFLQAWITWATPFWDGIQWITDNTNIFNTWFNIGIGTIFPITKLDISGDLRIGIIDNNNSMNQILGVVAWENIVKWIDQSLLWYWSGNWNNIYNKNIWNVGIWNINPSVALQVSGSVIFWTTGSKIINSDYSMIAGSQNIIDESDYSIALGATNVITWYSTNSTIAGWNLCSIVWSSNSTIAGWNNNKIDWSMNSSIGWWITNLIWSWINKATFYWFIWWWMSNILYGGYWFIWWGRYNFIDEFVNGVDNDWLSSIVWGESNEIYNLKWWFIWWGKQNKINSWSDYSVIVWWELNAIYTWSPYSTIMWWAGHHISWANSFAAGRSVYINNDNVFAWNGDMLLPFSSTTDNTFLINAWSGVAINHASPSSALDVNGDVEIVTGYAYYLWDPTTTWTWRITTKNGNLSFQIYTWWNWIERSHVSP